MNPDTINSREPVPTPSEPIEGAMSRRELIERGVFGLLLLGAAGSLLAGCSSGGSGSSGASALPNPRWPMEDPGREQTRTPPPINSAKATCPSPLDIPTDVIPRSAWARGGPVYSRMNRADRAYDRITIHHDGIDAFTSTSRDSAARRLEQIRQSHLNRPREPFGDIGYHYLIDPGGRVWQGRDLSWQGAHVQSQNPGNLGICMLGNYNLQTPTPAQRAALDRFVRSQMSRYNIPVTRVATHMELAQTQCPGRNLQSYVKLTRSRGMTATA